MRPPFRASGHHRGRLAADGRHDRTRRLGRVHALDEAVDRALLLATGCDRPRVVVLPTASWPDGEETFRRWAAQGEAHFAALGAEVEPVLVRGAEDANDPAAAAAIGEADLVYISGGKPGHLLDALDDGGVGAALRAAHARGAVIAGCSAGAMVLLSLIHI